MNEDHYDGKCYACKKETKVRWKNLYTIGSEGTDLCMPCELIIVNLLRSMATDSAQKERNLHIDKKKLKNRISKLQSKIDPERIPIGGGNPYYKCIGCNKAMPEISISGHSKGCMVERIKKEIKHYESLLI